MGWTFCEKISTVSELMSLTYLGLLITVVYLLHAKISLLISLVN